MIEAASSSPESATNSIIPKDALEFIFLGTGPSASLPHVECLTKPPDEKQKCRTCYSALRVDGQKNIRRNTSGLFRVNGRNGKKATVVIDVGKNFQAAALEWFPKYGLRRIDAVLITHAHADALNGLDDLRAWTLDANIQPYIDIYVSESTMAEVKQNFPYTVSREQASNGGAVPAFKWHIIEDQVPFEVADTGIRVTPLAVHHGLNHRKGSPQGDSPCASTPEANPERPLTKPPLLCFAFKIEDAVVYMSDVNYIPEDVWSILLAPKNPIPVFVVDCINLEPHASHLSLRQAMLAIRRLGARRSYLTGFEHDLTHDDYEEILKGVAIPGPIDFSKASSAIVQRGLAELGDGKPQLVAPAFDGLRLIVSPGGCVEERTDTSPRFLF